MPNVDRELVRLSPWRKISLGTWTEPTASNIYGSLEVDVTRANAYIETLRERTGYKITLTHLVALAVSRGIAATPEANRFVVGNRVFARKTVDIFMHVLHFDEDGNADLSGVKVERCDEKGPGDVCEELRRKAERIRKNEEKEMAQTKALMGALPNVGVKWMLRITSFLMNYLNIDLSRFGTPRDAFGSAMVTSVGMMGIDIGFAPLVPYSKVPLIVVVGQAKKKPVVLEDGETIEPREMLPLSATIDHRIIDGYHGGRLIKRVREVLSDPEAELGLPDAVEGAA